jgi:hypothetical protein
MGMFDYITVDEKHTLNLPLEVITKHGTAQSNIVFQTKDTPLQSMARYKISDGGELLLTHEEGHWTQQVPVKEDATLIEKLSSYGHYVVERSWWEPVQSFYGSIRFYTSFEHPDYYERRSSEPNDWMRYESGWVEYCALFINSILTNDGILKVDYKEPKKLSDTQLAKKISEFEERRQKIQENYEEFLSPEQKLICSVTEVVDSHKTIMDEEDSHAAINTIAQLVKGYNNRYNNRHNEK